MCVCFALGFGGRCLFFCLVVGVGFGILARTLGFGFAALGFGPGVEGVSFTVLSHRRLQKCEDSDSGSLLYFSERLGILIGFRL